MRRFLLAATALIGLAGLSSPALAQKSANSFVDSISVNAHMVYNDGAYASIPNVEADLLYLGIKHVRGEVGSNVPLTAFTGPAANGVKWTFLSASGGSVTTSTITSFLALVQSVVTAVAGSVEAVEGPNEINNFPLSFNGSDITTGADILASAEIFQQALYSAVKANSALAGVKVLMFTGANAGIAGGGTVPAAPDPGVTSGYADYYTQHPYPNGYAPLTGVSLSAAAPGISTSTPIVYTETGYSTNGGTAGAVDAQTQAKWSLDLLFDTFKLGVKQTSLYELLDAYAPGSSQGDAGFGLFDYLGVAKPLAVAIHNLTSILTDTGSGTPSAYAASSYTTVGLPSSGQSLRLTRSDGSSDIILWAEPSIWNVSTGTPVAAPTEQVLVHLGASYAQVQVFDPLLGATVTSYSRDISDITVPVSDHPVIVRVGPALTTVQSNSGVPNRWTHY